MKFASVSDEQVVNKAKVDEPNGLSGWFSYFKRYSFIFLSVISVDEITNKNITDRRVFYE